MKRFIFLVVPLCYPIFAFGAPPTSSIPISSSSSSTTTSSCMGTADCDDYNPCTWEECFMGDCDIGPLDQAPCDDGLYCNGDDSCENSVCSVHSGDPCPSDTVCNEGTDSCDSNPVTSTTTTANQATTTSTSIINGTTTTSTNGGSLSISGYVMGATAEDVTVILAGTASITSITDTHGYYEFLNLTGGYYTLKAEKDGYSFEPPNYVIPNLTSVLVEMNFEATKTRCLAKSIYGADSEEVQVFRFFRDNVLSKTQEGQELIKLYYQWSPIMVMAMEADEEFKEDIKEMVDEVLGVIE